MTKMAKEARQSPAGLTGEEAPAAASEPGGQMSSKRRQLADGAQPSGGGTAEADLARASGRAEALTQKHFPPCRGGSRIHRSDRGAKHKSYVYMCAPRT